MKTPGLKSKSLKAGSPGQGAAYFAPGNLLILSQGTPPNFANARMHWRAKHKACQEWANHIQNLVIAMPLGWSIDSPKLTLTLFGMREPDFDNLVSRWKPVIDGLVRAGIIKDDKLSVIGSPTFKWEKAKKLVDQRIEIRVESRNEKHSTSRPDHQETNDSASR